MIKHTQVRHLSIGIERDRDAVYAFASRPENLPQWASGVGTGITRKGDHWELDTEHGKFRLDFEPQNKLGVMDHTVTLGDGSQVYVPMRALANGAGTEVVITLYRQPEMDDAAFEKDAKTISGDLAALKKVLEKK